MKKKLLFTLLVFISIINSFGQGWIDPWLTYDMQITAKDLGLKGKVKSIDGEFFSTIKPSPSYWYEESCLDKDWLPIYAVGGNKCTFNEQGNVVHMEWCPAQWKWGFSADYTYNGQNQVTNIKIITLGKHYNEMNISFVYMDGLLLEKRLVNVPENYVNFRKFYTTTYSYDDQNRLISAATKVFKSSKKGVEEIDSYSLEYAYTEGRQTVQKTKSHGTEIEHYNKSMLQNNDEESFSTDVFYNEHGDVSKVYEYNSGKKEYEYQYDKHGNWRVRRKHELRNYYDDQDRDMKVLNRSDAVIRNITYYE